MQPENLAYAFTQIVHNFGAVAVVGGAGAALWPPPAAKDRNRALAGLVAAGWAMQFASGAAFGGISYYAYGRLPDIHGAALGALYLKIACAAAGLVLAMRLGARAALWDEARLRRAWRALMALGATALAAAAFLRWLS